MRATQILRAKGFWKRSLDEVKRVTNSAIKQEGLTIPQAPYVLLDLRDPDEVEGCKRMCDADIGGYSTVSLNHIPQTDKEPAHMRFHGTISTELPRNRPQVQRSGYAGWRNIDRPFTLLGRSLWNIDPYAFVGLRVKSDGRKYFVNLQSETIVPTDIHQHRLYTKRPGEWETVLIRWNDFVRTNHGLVVEPQAELLRQKVRTIGISLIDRVPGPYDLAVSRIWATNNPEGGLPDQETIRAESGKGEAVQKKLQSNIGLHLR